MNLFDFMDRHMVWSSFVIYLAIGLGYDIVSNIRIKWTRAPKDKP
jgi:hypothetical protein